MIDIINLLRKKNTDNLRQIAALKKLCYYLCEGKPASGSIRKIENMIKDGTLEVPEVCTTDVDCFLKSLLRTAVKYELEKHKAPKPQEDIIKCQCCGLEKCQIKN